MTIFAVMTASIPSDSRWSSLECLLALPYPNQSVVAKLQVTLDVGRFAVSYFLVSTIFFYIG